ncbi:MAG: ribosome assembly RNA-binding protein YhbY [Oscillospiraceae bacterium]|nr:ribosome assembly RNA-binding protein YhbY [Oscillospiraceae bacterium]
MTSKERAALRAEANSLEPLFQVGKGGISDALTAQTDDALRARELIKLKVLTETSPVSVREAAEELAAKTNAEVVQVIGGVMVLYRYNKELHEEKKKTAVKNTSTEKKYSRPKKKSPFVDKKGRSKLIKKKKDER